jgi:hypothetical protein
MIRPKIRFRRRDSLLIFFGRNGAQLAAFNKRDRTFQSLPSFDGVNPGDYGKCILVLNRELYILKIAEFPKMKKALIEKAIQANIGEWSAFKNPKYIYFSYPRENKLWVLIAILKLDDYESIFAQLKARGLKAGMVIPESLCYSFYFKDKTQAVGLIKKEAGTELIFFDKGIRESQFIPAQKWGRESFLNFVRRIGQAGPELKEIMGIGPRDPDDFFPPDLPPVRYIKTEGEIDAILKGSNFFAAPLTKYFLEKKPILLSENERKYLKPGLALLLAGVVMLYAAEFFVHYRTVKGLKSELAVLQAETRDIEEKVGRLDRLKTQVSSVQKTVDSYPSHLQIFWELQKYFPEGTFVAKYTFHKNKAEFTGVSPRSSELMAKLSLSTILTDIKFKSAIDKDRDTGKDRFSIEFGVRK